MANKTLIEPSPLTFTRPLVTVDLVIFAIQGDTLCVLLVNRPDDLTDPFPGSWALPGGFIDVTRDASMEACAIRKLKEKTGVDAPYLEQLGSWGNDQRDPRGWSTTTVYLALIPMPPMEESSPNRAVARREWVDVDRAVHKPLAFDHNHLLKSAIVRLRSKVEYTSLPAFLLDQPFTLPQLQRTYEAVMGRPIDKSAFRKRMLDASFLEEMGTVASGSRKAAVGYRIKSRETAVTFPRTFKANESYPDK